MKFAVGVMLTSFGIFWGAEGAGAHWPGSDGAILMLVPLMVVLGLALSSLFRKSQATSLEVRPVTEGSHR